MCLPFVVLLELMSRAVCNEYITINEDGIMCRKKGELLWCYKWDNIAMLKKSNRFRQPSIEIITNDKMQNTKIRSPKEPYFQLSKQAKNAIQQFYKIDKSSLSWLQNRHNLTRIPGWAFPLTPDSTRQSHILSTNLREYSSYLQARCKSPLGSTFTHIVISKFQKSSINPLLSYSQLATIQKYFLIKWMLIHPNSSLYCINNRK